MGETFAVSYFIYRNIKTKNIGDVKLFWLN